MEGNALEFKLQKKSNTKRLAWAFMACSLLIHLGFLVSKLPSIDFSSVAKNDEKKETVIRVLLAKRHEKSVKRQIVETEISDQKLLTKKEAFLGKKDTTFARQTKAANTGSFKEAGLGSKEGRKRLAKRLEKSLKRQRVKDLSFSDLAAKTSVKKFARKKEKTVARSAAKGLENGNKAKKGLSRSSDYLEEIPLGDFTRLNTQEFEFYGFYHRIRQKLEQFWGANLQEQVEKIHKSGRSIASGSNLLTSLAIKMNSKGEIVQIHLNSTSGIKELDQVAIDAFNQAGPFPNPPKGMVKDGFATIKWGFAVEAN